MNLTLRSDELEWREVDHDIVVLDGRDATYLTLNSSGALLWRLLAAGATREALVNALRQAYDVDPRTAATDTDVFLETLDQQGLLAR